MLARQTLNPQTLQTFSGRRVAVCSVIVGGLLAVANVACVGGPSGLSVAAPGLAADATPAVGDAANGKRLFASRGCVGCHIVTGEFGGGTTGPEMRRAMREPTIAGTPIERTPENLWHFVENPAKHKPGTSMPRLPLTAAELNDLVGYLETLKQ